MTADATMPVATTPLGLARWWDVVAVLLVLTAATSVGIVGGRMTHDWKETRPLARHTGGQALVVLSEDGQLAAAAWPDGHAGLWRVPGGELLIEVADGAHDPTALAVSSDGNLLAVGGAGAGVSVFRRGQGVKPLILGLDIAAPLSLAIAGKGDRLACLARNGGVTVWDLANGKCLCAVESRVGPESHREIITFTAEDRIVTTVFTDGFNAMSGSWDSRTGEFLRYGGSTRATPFARMRLPFAAPYVSHLRIHGFLTDRKDRCETIALELLPLLDQIPPSLPVEDQWTPVAAYRPVEKPFAAFSSDWRTAVAASPDGQVSLFRPREAGDVWSEWQTWAAGAGVLVLLGWVATWIIAALRGRSQAAPEPPPAGTPLPSLALKVVVGLLFLQGLGAAVEAFVRLNDQAFYFDPAILSLPAAWGVLRLRRAWRVVALIQVWCFFISAGAMTGPVASGQPREFGWQFFSVRTGDAGPTAVGVFLAVATALALWVYAVLTSARTRGLFRQAHAFRTPDCTVAPPTHHI